MRFFIFGGLILLGALLQATVLNYIMLMGVKPDLVFILIILSGLFWGAKEGALWGAAGGLLLDILSGAFWGTAIISGLAAGYISGVAGTKLYNDKRLVVTGLVCLVFLFAKLVSFILLCSAGLSTSLFDALFRVIIPLCIYNSIIVLIFYGPFYRSITAGRLSS
ncbi:MAG: rod shape-determining protein MreD [Clostridiales bacterium]|nr:rod shape-determining protein MreD [Clostridiales bacterium]MCF8022279.1 rod shape-determining protein MreD [Clostridiales bacterium]